MGKHIQLSANDPRHEYWNKAVVPSCGYVAKKVVTGDITSSVVPESGIVDTSIAKSPADIPSMIKVYPNPVISGTNINIGCQKLKEGYYSLQLSNLSGQQVLNKQTWIDSEMQVLNIDIPKVSAGVYFLKLTNKETNKRFTQKIIIQ
ncbi:MAG TPA: T9SS type A sorting domain-containing protein [Chitinophagaceae bacterium]|nr:T9SS type A sorting domain-containing protein [Chitinophagaceae bacterium]